MTEVAYCTLEDAKTALDAPATSRSDTQIMREIWASSRGIEGDLKRYFYPAVSTQTFDWLDHQYSTVWRLWLDQRELLAITQVTSNGVDITADVFLRPDDAPLRGEPFTKIEINLASNSAFSAGMTYQRAITVVGTFGYTQDETSGGLLVSGFADTTATTATVSDGSQVGTGSIIRVDSERMIVTAKGMAATGQTLGGSGLALQNNVTTVPVQSGAAISPGETIQIDSEQMYVQSVTGTNLTVIRAWNGTVLAAHTVGATVYAARQVTVTRGALGTTAAVHAADTALAVHAVPSLIRDLCVAETVATLTQVRRGYGTVIKRSTGSSSSPGDPVDLSSALPDLRVRARNRYARVRTRTSARLI